MSAFWPSEVYREGPVLAGHRPSVPPTADEFAGKLAKRVAALSVGNPYEGEFVLGSVVGPCACAVVLASVRDRLTTAAIRSTTLARNIDQAITQTGRRRQ
jgi:hypothetical protein